MPPVACPRCQRTNPQGAAYCYFDGSSLGAGATTGDGQAAQRLPHEFIFPSGRRCQNYDQLAAGCQEEWAAARDLLQQGVFRQYFTSIGRMDLARTAQEAMTAASSDIGLTQLVGSLPVTATAQGPKLDLSPRRLMLGNMFAGETKQVQLTVSNQGQGMLQGTVAVTEGEEWLRLAGVQSGQQAVQTAREQQVALQVSTRSLAAGQSYGGKLTVITNGGVVEVPARVDLAVHPFAKSPFQGAKAPRDMAERMRSNPKGAAALLETGELSKWFSSNGWKYPVAGPLARGVAGVQQFFEAMGLSKPPLVKLSQDEVRLTCHAREKTRGQLALQTAAKKWVYGNVSSDADWLKILTPAIAGPQQAAIAFEVDPRQLPAARAEATLKVVANANQTLTTRVRVRAEGARAAASRGPLNAVVAMALAFVLLRLLLIFPADFHARPQATAAAAGKVAQQDPRMLPEDSAANNYTGWLTLPWFRLLLVGDAPLPELRLPESVAPGSARQFRDAFISHFLRTFVGWTWWLGALLGPLWLWQRGASLADLPWGIIAGAVLGVMASATLACLVLVLDLVPQLIWDLTLRHSGAPILLVVWLLLALLCWAGLGALVGLLLAALGPLGKALLAPVQHGLAGLCRMCGLTGLADFCAPA
jgi:hypothetical protein